MFFMQIRAKTILTGHYSHHKSHIPLQPAVWTQPRSALISAHDPHTAQLVMWLPVGLLLTTPCRDRLSKLGWINSFQQINHHTHTHTHTYVSRFLCITDVGRAVNLAQSCWLATGRVNVIRLFWWGEIESLSPNLSDPTPAGWQWRQRVSSLPPSCCLCPVDMP